MKSENRTKPKANAAKLIELTKFLATKLPGGAWAYKEREREVGRGGDRVSVCWAGFVHGAHSRRAALD